MKSVLEQHEPSFAVLQARLVALVRARIHNGEFSERALARSLNVSQPQLHNVLKGVRKLQPALADEILRELKVSALKLITSAELEQEQELRQGRVYFWTEATQGPRKKPMGAQPARDDTRKAG